MRGGMRRKVIIDTPYGKFDSKAEYLYYEMLLELQQQGHIKHIERQTRYNLPNASSASDRGGYYKADFVVIDSKDREHVIDVKGFFEDASRIKIAFTEYMYGIEVKIVKCKEAKENKKWKYSVFDTSFITAE